MAEMTIDLAEQIISSRFYDDYSEEELRAAIQTLQSDPTKAYILNRFYNNVEESTKVINASNDKLTWPFWELTHYKKLFDVVENDENIKSAAEKLDAAIVEKFSSLNFITAGEIEYAEYLAGKITDADVHQKAQDFINKKIAKYESMNGLDQDFEVLNKNDQTLSEALDNLKLYADDGKISEDFRALAALVERIEIQPLPENADKNPEEVKRSNMEMIFEAAKLQTHASLVGNMGYLLSPKQKQKEQIVEDILEKFKEQILLTSVASKLGKEDFSKIDSAKKLQEYVKSKEDILEKLDVPTSIEELKNSPSNVKLQIKENDVITACADTEHETVLFNKYLERKIGKISQLRGQVEKFSQKATSLWGKTYTIRKNIINNFKDNKYMHYANTGMTAVVAIAGMTASAPAVGAAIGAYAVYSAAGAWVWPVIAEARKMQREALEKGGEKPAFGKAWKEAWAKLKNDKNYKNRAGLGTVVGIIGGMVGFGGASIGVNTVAQRGVAALSRMAGSLSAQTMAYINAKKDYEQNKNEENKAKLKAAGISLGLGAAISGLGAWFSIDRMASANSQVLDTVTNTPTPKAPVDSLGVKAPVDSLGAKAPVDSLGAKAPVDSLGVKAPVDSLGVKAPVDSLGVKTPVDSLGVKAPVDSLGVNTPADSTVVDAPETAVVPEPEIPAIDSPFNAQQLHRMEAYAIRIFGQDEVDRLNVIYLENEAKFAELGIERERMLDALARGAGYPAIEEGRKLLLELGCKNVDAVGWEKIAASINAFEYEKGTITVQAMDNNGNVCDVTTGRWGNYVGPGKDGIRTFNRVTGVLVTGDCPDLEEKLTIESTGGCPNCEPKEYVEPQPQIVPEQEVEPQPEPVIEPEPREIPEPVIPEITTVEAAQTTYAKEFDPHIWNDAKYDAFPRGFGTDSENFKELTLSGKDGDITIVYQGTDKETGDMSFKVKGGEAEWSMQPVPGVDAIETGKYILVENYHPQGEDVAKAAAEAAGINDLNHLALCKDGNYHMFTEHGEVTISQDGQNVSFTTQNERGVPANIQNQVVKDAITQFNTTDGNNVRIEGVDNVCADTGTKVEVTGRKAAKIGFKEIYLGKFSRGGK